MPAQRFSRWYMPGAMVVAALVILTPPLAFGGDWMTWIYRGLATLLIACPCALVISTPAAIASGLAAGARQGLLDGVAFGHTACALDRDSRKSALAHFLGQTNSSVHESDRAVA